MVVLLYNFKIEPDSKIKLSVKDFSPAIVWLLPVIKPVTPMPASGKLNV